MAEPALLTVRALIDLPALPLTLKVAVAAAVVAPAPAKVPPDQLSALLTVRVPPPSRVPPSREKLVAGTSPAMVRLLEIRWVMPGPVNDVPVLSVEAPLKVRLADALLMLNVPLLVPPLLSWSVPVAMFTVPVLFNAT